MAESYFAAKRRYLFHQGLDPERIIHADDDWQKESEILTKMLVTYEDAVNVSRCLDYVCCRDIAVPLETPLGDDVDKVLCLGANMVETPAYAAQIVAKHLRRNPSRASKLKGLVKTEELKLVKEKDAIKFSRHGYKSRDDLEA
ncbi:hypothetical protein Pmar_PMAR028232 [Perkinsus marinus ATCC 50983]|uniref:Uncharacterized protein n=1 Tax=Perkinsus marinus (strain ATCC 50983 / TXsc) TaxID=423536 RepID=C5LBB6_PERM5|nr:hypothetical protein Pmar_PMAR028232 [Perkinsus marinus ATCC 50983]EER06044.1 hypothetical protein Pmar_PMAR028232 [Perkinsus marinus ATCC 50983]|eukprot:XP_002774228.1 hypothetical protein Pmar_PMAR028232 [Perkinsus marinus ATCC 50983]